MKIYKAKVLLLLIPVALWAEENGAASGGIDLSDVVVIDDTKSGSNSVAAGSGSVEVVTDADIVEIPDAPVAGASIDIAEPTIPVVETALPMDTEVVLELPGQEQGTGAASMADEETITVDFPDEDVRVILRNVADLFDLNLVIPDVLQGRTSVKLRNITWRQVFEVVLDPLGYTYVEDRNIIRIKSVEELTGEPVDTRVFIANYARASELQSSIAPLIDAAAGGRVEVDQRSNALVITERPSRMNKIQDIIERLDKATDQVMIESKFIEVTNNDVKNLGVNWASLSGYGMSAGPFQRQWSQGTARDLQNKEEGTFSSVTSGASTGTTNTTNTADPIGDPTTITSSNAGTLNSVVDEVIRNVTDARMDTAVFSADQFEVILSALKTSNDIELVSNPTVVTLNNKQAKIAIGEKYPIPSYTFNAETGQRQLDEIEYEDIGITLDVTPSVNDAGFINLDIIPEVSSRLGFAIVENTEIPIIASRRTETNITIKDGFTLAIGGLVENTTGKKSTKVPLLGDLPGLGRLFRSESDSMVSRNLIIFITAKTLNPDGSTYEDVIDPRVIHEMGILPSDLPGYDLPTQERQKLSKIQSDREGALRKEEIIRLESELNKLKVAEEMKEQKIKEELEGRKSTKRL